MEPECANSRRCLVERELESEGTREAHRELCKDAQRAWRAVHVPQTLGGLDDIARRGLGAALGNLRLVERPAVLERHGVLGHKRRADEKLGRVQEVALVSIGWTR